MKVIIEIPDNKGCCGCPYCRYVDDYDGWREEDFGREPRKEGFYCRNSGMRYITDYRSSGDVDIPIPDWCELSFIK